MSNCDKEVRPKKVTLNVGTLMIDGQDGGYTMYVYDSYEAAKKVRDANVKEWLEDNELDVNDEAIEEQASDEYQHGYLGKDTIELLVMPNGKVKLAKPLSFHAGQ